MFWKALQMPSTASSALLVKPCLVAVCTHGAAPPAPSPPAKRQHRWRRDSARDLSRTGCFGGILMLLFVSLKHT